MKEEKDHRPKEKRVTLFTPQGATGGCIGATAEGAKGDDRQDRNRDKKEALRDKGKKSENTESICSLEKIEKKEEVVKRDRIRNKDRPAMQLYQPGARSRSRLCPADDSIKPGDSPVDKKQESGISHRKEGGEE